MRINLHSIGTVRSLHQETSVTQDDFRQSVVDRASFLEKAGVGPQDMVLICHGGTTSFFADLLAVWWLDACAVCLNPGLTEEELSRISDLIDPVALLIADDQPAPNVTGIKILCPDSESTPATDTIAPSSSGLDAPAIILFTSGTTGEPKGVVHTFRSLLARVALNQQFIGMADMSKSLCPLPTHFGHGLIGNCLTPLLAGGDLLLISGNDIGTVSSLGKIIDEHQITFMSSVPALWKLATKVSAQPNQKSLRRLHIGSAPLSADLWNAVSDWAGTPNVVNMYGITETANWLAGASAADQKPEDGLIGKMWGGFAAILDEAGTVRSTGEGELLVQSPSVMQGYFKKPEMTAEVLRNGWFHTGDIGTISPDGVMRLTGRQKYEINRAGMKVHPEDIDLLLERHPYITEACAFVIPDEIAGETVGVALVAQSDSDVDIPAIKSWCESRLVKEKLPEKWFVLDEIPKSDRGKVNRDIVAGKCIGTD